MRTTKCLLMAFLAISTIGGNVWPAHATAIYTASLKVNLDIPAAIPNVLAVTPNNDSSFSTPSLTSGDAGVTSLGPPTSTVAGGRLTFDTGIVSGFAGPGLGVSLASSGGSSQSISLANLLTATGIDITLTGDQTFALVANAGAVNENATAAASFDITVARPFLEPVSEFDFARAVSAPPGAVLPGPLTAFTARTFTLGPGTTVNVRITGSARGTAEVVPEPSTLLLLSSGLIGLSAWGTRKFRKGLSPTRTLLFGPFTLLRWAGVCECRQNGASTVPQAVQSRHGLLHWLIPQLDKFPRSRRFTLGERIEAGVLDVLELLVEAAYTRTKEAALRRANLRLEVVRHLWRLGYELKVVAVSLSTRFEDDLVGHYRSS